MDFGLKPKKLNTHVKTRYEIFFMLFLIISWHRSYIKVFDLIVLLLASLQAMFYCSKMH
jgi:hypothetical protein